MPHMYKIITLKGKCSGNHHFKMLLAPNMYKIITVKANPKEIVTLKCM